MGPSSIGWVGKHQGNIRTLKQGNRGCERTCNALATARLLSAVLWTDLGEVSNWRALVDDLRHELMDWVLDYLTELTAHSIFRIRGWWRPIRRDCAGGREERMNRWCGLPWHSLAEGLRRSLVSCCG
jgi:hypothetical protein